jgi:hypothetical protein
LIEVACKYFIEGREVEVFMVAVEEKEGMISKEGFTEALTGITTTISMGIVG